MDRIYHNNNVQRIGLMEITEKQLSDMKHAIGYDSRMIDNDGIYNAYRNFFGVRKEVSSWEELVLAGYATKRTVFADVVYHLTDKAISYLEGILSIKITRN